MLPCLWDWGQASLKLGDENDKCPWNKFEESLPFSSYNWVVKSLQRVLMCLLVQSNKVKKNDNS